MIWLVSRTYSRILRSFVSYNTFLRLHNGFPFVVQIEANKIRTFMRCSSIGKFLNQREVHVEPTWALIDRLLIHYKPSSIPEKMSVEMCIERYPSFTHSKSMSA